MPALTDPIATVCAWLTAVNAGDADAAVALSALDLLIHGPRGTARGREVLQAWIARAGASFATQSTYARGDRVVVAQRAIWRGKDDGLIQSEATVATWFRVEAGLVTEVQRTDTLPLALEAAALSEADRVVEAGRPAGA